MSIELLAQKLIGKKVGDIVDLITSGPQLRTGKIIEVKSKYVYALHESTTLFQTLFPDANGFYSLNLELDKDKNDPHKGLKPVFDQIDEQHKHYEQIKDLYKAGKITVGVFAELLGRNAIEGWGFLTNQPDIGLKCCLGTNQEKNDAVELLSQDKKLIIDITSLMTIHGIGLANEVFYGFGKLGISQSTIDLLNQVTMDRRSIESKGFMSVGKEGEKYVREKITAKQIKNNTVYLEGIKKWIQKRCEIIPCRESLKMATNEKVNLDKLFGVSFIDSVLIVKQENGLLFSDDERLRTMSKNTYGIQGVWTQVVLIRLLGKGVITRQQYSEASIKLANSNYHHTSIDAFIMVECAKQSGWKPTTQFVKMVGILNGKNCDDQSAINVASDFIHRLYTQSLYVSDPKDILFVVLDEFTKERIYRKLLLRKLVGAIHNHFILISEREKEIIALINSWASRQIV